MNRFLLPLRFSIPGVLFIFATSIGWFSFQREVSLSNYRKEEQASQEAKFSANQISGILQYMYRQENIEGAELVLNQLAAYSDIKFALLCDENNQITLSTNDEFRHRSILKTSLAKSLPIIENTRNQMSAKLVFSPDRQRLQVAYPVELKVKIGGIKSSTIGVILLEYDISARKKRAYIDALQRTLKNTFVLAFLCTAVWLFFHKTLTLRVSQLVAASNSLAEGRLDVRAKLQGFDELAQISQAFDQMADRVEKDRQALQQSQVKLAFAHAETIAKAEQLRITLVNLQQTQGQLIQTEKMSSLGQMVAGVAHEINNPVSFIYGNLTYANEYIQQLLKLISLYQQHYLDPPSEIVEYMAYIELDFLLEDLPKMLSSMEIGAERISQIVLSLRNFSRLDESEMKPVNIHEGIDSTLLILQHRLKSNSINIEVIKQYCDLPLVECYAGQLNQVFFNIINNAIDAIEESLVINQNSPIKNQELLVESKKQIYIYTELVNLNWVKILIIDNGSGMTERVKKQIFDPFFTTKSVGNGTGLGLSTSYQIVVEKHRGKLYCDSQPGEKTKFMIEIPVRQHNS